MAYQTKTSYPVMKVTLTHKIFKDYLTLIYWALDISGNNGGREGGGIHTPNGFFILFLTF